MEVLTLAVVLTDPSWRHRAAQMQAEIDHGAGAQPLAETLREVETELRSLNFAVHARSRKSKSVYFRLADYQGLLRVSDHPRWKGTFPNSEPIAASLIIKHGLSKAIASHWVAEAVQTYLSNHVPGFSNEPFARMVRRKS